MKILKKLPDTISIVLSILILFIVLTWIIPKGEYDRKEANGKNIVVPDSYKSIETETISAPVVVKDYLPSYIWKPVYLIKSSIGTFFLAPIKGFISAADIIAFVFLVGGAFGIINKTGAINAGLQNIINFSIRKPQYKKLIIPVIMILFSLGGATFGMCEEVLVFIMITIPMAKALGYNSIIGVAIPFVGAGAGFAGAFNNPFTVGIAQGIAEIPPFSGAGYRFVVWIVMTTIAVTFVMIYARKIEKKKKQQSLIDNLKLTVNSQQSSVSNLSINKNKNSDVVFTGKRKLVLLGLLIAIVLLIVGSNSWGWYINEISGLFIGLGIVAALICHLPTSDAIGAFVEGAKDMFIAAFIIGLTKGLIIIATEGQIIDTILYFIAYVAGSTPRVVSVEIMFVFQSLLNFFIPSGSGQAALTMPIITPLSDILQISRQTAVLAFQLGDGLSNMIIPTSGVTMGVLAIAKIPYRKWLKWLLPLMILFFVAAMLLLIPPVLFFQW